MNMLDKFWGTLKPNFTHPLLYFSSVRARTGNRTRILAGAGKQRNSLFHYVGRQ